jgi:cytochrome c-type biogenesis protein CcmE
MRKRDVRLMMVAVGGVLLSGTTFLVATGLKDNIVYFNSPSDIAAKMPAPDRRISVGGLVAEGTVKRDLQNRLTFTVTDRTNTIAVVYAGDPPDLFREGQGVVAEGRLGVDGIVVADRILAKHDENYMPREVAESLKKSGNWRPETGAPPPKGAGS